MAARLTVARQIAPSLCRLRSASLATSHQYWRWLQPAPTKGQMRLNSTVTFTSAQATRPHREAQTSSLASDEKSQSDTCTDTDRVPDGESPRSMPWYLEPELQPDEPGSHANSQSPISQNPRHAIPALPECPPPILLPLLQNLSTEQGLDDLTLLDLRTLDPPPALGSNLLMILCTARSEKHVHVSADRVCRFLGSLDESDTVSGGGTGALGYGGAKLKPVADGLLGRNELRLRLKRKAKRNRIMSSGGQGPGYLIKDERGEVDDGLRTGWVCVNVGRVEGGELGDGRSGGEDVVGFNEDESGSRVVIQIMTEEKRGQLQLEELWQGMLHQNRHDR